MFGRWEQNFPWKMDGLEDDEMSFFGNFADWKMGRLLLVSGRDGWMDGGMDGGMEGWRDGGMNA